MARMKASTQRYPPTPWAKRVNFWAGHYGVDLCLEPTGNGQKGGGANFASTGAPTNRECY